MASSKSTGKRTRPPWNLPVNTTSAKLKLYNSLTRNKDEFIPEIGNKIRWYSCGPTVYDTSHLGHARSYISFDIIRRVLRDYFAYNVFYVMNITDIDDKIIKRARHKYLLEKYILKDKPVAEILVDIDNALDPFIVKLEKCSDMDTKHMYQQVFEQSRKVTSKATLLLKSVDVEIQPSEKQALIDESADILCDWLDEQYGSTVTDNSIFSDLPAKWEEDFFQDMETLKVLPPDVVTRVSEHVPEIIDFITKIMENGMAYESNGCVYFDTVKFDDDPNHFYAKLVPEAFGGDLRSLHEGEGDLSVSKERLDEKKNPSDFALWKASKAGEPSWDSPWGKGRPGWHIECSVMASAHLGSSMDIHTGGYDLKFPHHDNELAQSEAYFGNDSWVRYFLHSGHLTILGCKMSKSLKNFITIKEALQDYTTNQLRFFFLLHSWSNPLDYCTETLQQVIVFEKNVKEFFLNVKDALRSIPPGAAGCAKWEYAEMELHGLFRLRQAEVHVSLCDSIDTRNACLHIRDLISACNIYIRNKKSTSSTCNSFLLRHVAGFVSQMFQIFGVIDKPFVFTPNSSTETENTNLEEQVMPYLSALADFREKVRQSAKDLKASSLLQQCDELRDDILPNLGVRLEDYDGTVIKLVDKETLLKEKALKQKMEEEKQLEKERKRKQLEEAQAAKDAQRRIAPTEMFKSETDKYSLFDDKGMPTHDIEGKELSKGQLKKLQKLYTAQEKKYNDYVKEQSDCNNAESS